MLAKVYFLFACVCTCAAHLCMLSPPQRSPLTDINKAGSDSCIFLTEPCGKTNASKPVLSLKEGSNFTVIFQKNLDHYNNTPGYFSVSIGAEGDDSFKELYKIDDSDTPSLTLYPAIITIPTLPGVQAKHMVIQSRYVTKNPKAPKVFYQCSDIMITK